MRYKDMLEDEWGFKTCEWSIPLLERVRFLDITQKMVILVERGLKTCFNLDRWSHFTLTMWVRF